MSPVPVRDPNKPFHNTFVELVMADYFPRLFRQPCAVTQLLAVITSRFSEKIGCRPISIIVQVEVSVRLLPVIGG